MGVCGGFGFDGFESAVEALSDEGLANGDVVHTQQFSRDSIDRSFVVLRERHFNKEAV